MQKGNKKELPGYYENLFGEKVPKKDDDDKHNYTFDITQILHAKISWKSIAFHHSLIA